MARRQRHVIQVERASELPLGYYPLALLGSMTHETIRPNHYLQPAVKSVTTFMAVKWRPLGGPDLRDQRIAVPPGGDEVRETDEFGHETGGRMVEYLFGPANLLHRAPIHHGDDITHEKSFFLVVGDKDSAYPAVFEDFQHVFAHLFPQPGVQVGERRAETRDTG